jgi:8-amino-7-oxononanoate synthase
MPVEQPTRHGEEASASGDAPDGGAGSRELEPERYRFELCPEVRELEGRIHAAQTQGASNPYFRLGDGVSEQTLVVEGREVINYSGYNYLGLAAHPHVKAAVVRAIERYGTSVSASRIASGDRPLHRELERALAAWLGVPACIAFVGGHATNETTIGHLFNGEDLILTDALSHNSLLQGCRLSGATHLVFPHNDWRHLDELLGQRRHRYRRALIVIEGLYSMDGDIPELPRFIDIKRRHKSFLMVDEAHSIGVLGRTGRGIAEHFQVDPSGVDLWMGTLSKALASCGGYIACQESVAEYLKYTAPGFVYSVGMTPSNAAAALAALQVLQQDASPLAVLKERASLFLELARSAGLDTGMSQGTPVIPIMLGDSLLALRLSNGLLQRGICVQPVISPAVQERAARLRFFLNCLHTEEQIRYTVAAVAEELERAQRLPPKREALAGR